MVKSFSFLLFFYVLLVDAVCAGQELDLDDYTEREYVRLMEMLSDLELSHRDTIPHARICQNLIMSVNGCLKPQPAKGYLGDASSHTIRYKIKVNEDWQAGLVLNKDVGEPFRRRIPFYDSYSAYIKYRNTIVGHYRVRLGSGLILNQHFTLGKNIISDSFMSSGTNLSPHSSTDEYNYMQGVATTLQFGHVQVLPFISFKQIDSVVSNDTITSIPEDGYHRSANERRKRHTANVINTGVNISTRADWIEVGVSVLFTRFSLPFFRPSRAYNINYYRGKQLLQGSIDFHARRFGFELRGETAIDQNLNIATIAQLSRKLGEDWKASLLFRHFSRKYQQLYAASVSEGSCLQGEQGMMFNVSGEPFPYWRVRVLFDYFHFSTTQYPNLAPYSGFELRAQASYSRHALDGNISYRLKSKNAWQHSLDFMSSYTLPIGLKLKTQLRSKLYSPKDKGGFHTGYALAQAVSYELKIASGRSRFSEYKKYAIELQVAWYDAEDYNTRIYLSERNILYSSVFPMLYGKGFRSAMTCTYNFNQRLAFDLQFLPSPPTATLQARIKF